MNEYTFDYVERNRLDAFCKAVLRNEAKNYLSEMARHRDREKSLDRKSTRLNSSHQL